MAGHRWWPWTRAPDESRQPQGPSGPADLTEDWNLLSTLLERPDDWRVRAVEQLTVGSARVCRRHRSIQVAPLTGLLGDNVESDTAYILLPVDRLTKRPLLRFDVAVDDKPAYVVPRRSTADIEAAHIVALAAAEGVVVDELTEQYLSAICEYTPATWQRFRASYRFQPRRALRRYLEQGLDPLAEGDTPPKRLARLIAKITAAVEAAEDQAAGWLRRHVPALLGQMARVDRRVRKHLPIQRDIFRDLRAESMAIGRLLRAALGEGPSAVSSADNPLLAAPLLAERQVITSIDDLHRALRGLRAVVEALNEQASNPRGSRALRTMAEFGRRWQALVWCEVPLARPFVVTIQHDVPLRLGWFRAWAVQAVSLADAGSNHVSLHTADENVEIAEAELRGVDHQRLEHTLATGIRRSREGFAIYTAEPDRDHRALIRFRLTTPLPITLASLTVHLITWLAGGLTALLLCRRTLSAADLAVLVVPTTFAASLLLTRERNSLARRIQRPSRTGTALATVALWSLAAYAYIGAHLVVST